MTKKDSARISKEPDSKYKAFTKSYLEEVIKKQRELKIEPSNSGFQDEGK